MIKYLHTTTLLLAFTLCAQAQQLFSPSGDHFVKTQRNIHDTADICAFYQLRFLKDSTKTNDYTTCQTALMISDKYTLFGDYQRLVADSLNDYLAQGKRQSKDKRAKALWYNAVNAWHYQLVTLNDLTRQETTVQIYDILRSYEYSYPTPEIAWQLEQGDTIINKLTCKKAICTYAGRRYEAWYAENVPLPYGPHVFGGLPGLIILLQDTKRNWIFTNTSIGRPANLTSIYTYQRNFIQPIVTTTREKALESYRNDIENYANLSITVFNVKVMKDGKWTTPEPNRPKRPSNLLELEW